jgi:hypothetical protein
MFSAGFELAIPAIVWLETYALDRTATATSKQFLTSIIL